MQASILICEYFQSLSGRSLLGGFFAFSGSLCGYAADHQFHFKGFIEIRAAFVDHVVFGLQFYRGLGDLLNPALKILIFFTNTNNIEQIGKMVRDNAIDPVKSAIQINGRHQGFKPVGKNG